MRQITVAPEPADRIETVARPMCWPPASRAPRPSADARTMNLRPFLRRSSHARVAARVVALALIAAVALPLAASATNFRLFGPGPRYAAMAGAFTAVADDFTGAYANTAGIIQKTSTRVGVGYQYAYMDLTAQGEADENGAGTDGLYLGFVFTLPFIDWLKDRVAFGYNYFQPVDYILSLQVPAATTPQFVLLEQYPRANIMHAGFATAVTGGSAGMSARSLTRAMR